MEEEKNIRYTVMVSYAAKDGTIRTEMFDSEELCPAGCDRNTLIRLAAEKTSAYARTEHVLSAEVHQATDNEIFLFESRKKKRELNRQYEFFRNFNRTADIDEIGRQLRAASSSFRDLQDRMNAAVGRISAEYPDLKIDEMIRELIRYYTTFAAVFPTELTANRKEEDTDGHSEK